MHKQITAADRKVIEVLLKKDCTIKEISRELGKDYTTICR
ncbi:helix-turn-helix domain-containing protein, partial [Candidatus Dojkabacteria bacterium]|nr:helix-turn-helix domain-containing protein [Candidatus Dojkabacteria bacterium]